MLGFVRIYILVFGILTIAGGVMGFVKAKSKPSLVAGGVAGLLLVLAAYLFDTPNAQGGSIIATLTCIALAGRFVPAFVKTKKVMPAGMMAALSVIGVVLMLSIFARQ
jgi:uncharacterized membrane protein (UPF0136 family)